MSKTLRNIQEQNEDYYKISSNEKVQIARETNRGRLPREIKKWLQSLDLSYKIKFISKDLANGFSVAEILSRYPVPYVTNIPYPVNNYYRVNMQEFSNGLSYKERLTNWKHITDILKRKYQMPFPEELPGKVLSYAPNAAFDFLCLLYKFLTKRELKNFNKIDETDKFMNYAELELMPAYMRPTANMLVRDKETQRIQDDLIRKQKIQEILDNHNKYLAAERENFVKVDQFYRSQKVKLKKIENNPANSALSSYNNKVEKVNTIPTASEVENEEESQSKAIQEQGLKEEHINLLGILSEISDDAREQDNVLSEFRTMVRKNFIETDRNIEMDLKNYPNDKDILEYFFEKIHLCSEDNLGRIFLAFEDKENEFVGIISRTLIELDPFVRVVCEFYEALYRNGLPHKKFHENTLKICKSVRDITKEKCDNVFLNFCIEYLLDMIEKNPLYRNEMCEIIFNLTLNTTETNLAILKKVSKSYSHKNELLFYHVIVRCLENVRETDDVMTNELFLVYSNAIVKGLSSADETINIKAMYLANQLVRFDFFLCLQYHRDIFKHSSSFNWEILSLIIIYCSLILKEHNKQKIGKEKIFGKLEMSQVVKDDSAEKDNKSIIENIKNIENIENDKNNDNVEVIKTNRSKKSGNEVNQINNKSQIKDNNNNNSKQSQNQEQNKNNSQNLSKRDNNSKYSNKENITNKSNIENINENINENKESNINNEEPIEDESARAKEEFLLKLEEVQKKEDIILETINKIFDATSPHMTVKIGFIYLSEVIEFYPELAKKYMKLLIEYKDNTIRSEVLSVDKYGMENEYTINCFTEKYKFCGAPRMWNQLIVAGIFRDYILEEKIAKFEATHLTILKSIIINQEFDEEKAEDWVKLYDDLKIFLFFSLSDSLFSSTALEILTKFFGFAPVHRRLLEGSFDLLISTMREIYSENTIENPRKNMLSLLEFLACNKIDSGFGRNFVYTLVKRFAIENDKKYIKSNLLNLMNEISNERRGNIFE